MIRSNGARAASSGESMPSATASSSSPAPWPSFTPLIAALSRATSTATGSMSVAMHLRLGPQRQRGEGEQAGAGADVGDIGEALAVALEPVERGEAAGGGRVLAGAEGEAGVDLEIDPCPRSGAMGRRVDVEAAGADRLQPGLAHRHPVGLAELLDARRRRGRGGAAAASSSVVGACSK